MNPIDCALNLRDFLDVIRKRGDLVDIAEEVDTDLEIAAITRLVYEERLPAPLFKNIKDALPGARVLGAPAGMLADRKREYARLALHFGLPERTRPRTLLEAILSAMEKLPIAPRIVQSAPCKENKWVGEEIDLMRLPVPLLHEKDGGRYIGTYGFHVVQSPDGSWDSWSIGRMMLVDKNRMTGPAIPTQHIGMIREMWREQGKPTPWAFVLGGPPAAVAVAGMPLPAFVSEPGYVGALLGTAVDVVKAELSGMMVPAHSEIIIEGEISLDETAEEGPMGEYHGYQHDKGKAQPLFHVRSVTFRNEPILPICVAGLPAEENHTIWGTMIAAQVLSDLRKAELPVDMAWCSYEAATCWTVVSMDLQKLGKLGLTARELADRMAQAYFSTHAGYLVPKLIITGNDIDITNIDEVVWVLATRAHPLTDFVAYPDIPGFPMVPYLTSDDLRKGSGGNMVINCLFPEQLEGKLRAGTASFEHSYPESLKAQIRANREKYGY